MESSETKEAVRLMQGIAQQGSMHLCELDGDFAQVRDLLTLSIERICASFMRIAQLATPGEPGSDRGTAPEGSAALASATPADLERRLEEIAMIGASVTTELQFHDMISQVLARACGRVNGLHGLLSQLSDLSIHLEFEDSEQHRAQGLAFANQRMLSASQELATRLRKTVSQKNLDVGDIELF